MLTGGDIQRLPELLLSRLLISARMCGFTGIVMRTTIRPSARVDPVRSSLSALKANAATYSKNSRLRMSLVRWVILPN
jgi:hypothetical protein